MTAPSELQKYVQWVLWRLESRNKDKQTKVPYSIRGTNASSTNKHTWASFEAVCEALEATRGRDSGYSGIGFVLTREDPFVGVDLDHCIKNGTIEEWAQAIVDKLNSYTEITPSGEGLRIFIKGELPPQGRKRGNFEVYAHSRFLTITGNHLEGTPLEIFERQEEILEVHTAVFGIGSILEDRQIDIAGLPEIQLGNSSLSDKETKELHRKLRRLAKQSPLFSLTLLRQRADLPDQSQSSYDLALARRCALTGEFTPREITAVIAIHREHHDQSPAKAARLDYLQRTITKGFKEVMDD